MPNLNEILDWNHTKVGESMKNLALRNKRSVESSLSDFADYAINLFSIEKCNVASYQEWADRIAQREDDYFPFIYKWMNDVHKSMNSNGVIDWFGEMYESMFQSKGKASALGQFFTPMSVSQVMSDVVFKEEHSYEVKVCDCACGSGRTLLSHWNTVLKKGMYHRHAYVYIADDLDIMSCKMCALNMMAAGMYGSVACHDTLRWTVPHTIFVVNECKVPFPTPMMSIRTLHGDEAREWWFSRSSAGSHEKLLDIFNPEYIKKAIELSENEEQRKMLSLHLSMVNLRNTLYFMGNQEKKDDGTKIEESVIKEQENVQISRKSVPKNEFVQLELF